MGTRRHIHLNPNSGAAPCYLCDCHDRKLTVTSEIRVSPSRCNSCPRLCHCQCHRNADLSSCSSSYGWSRYPIPERERNYSVLDRWFEKSDEDNDGCLNLEELGSLFGNLGLHLKKSETNWLLNLADSDRDSRLSYAEFYDMWHKIAFHETEIRPISKYRDLLDIVKDFNIRSYVLSSGCSHPKYFTSTVEVFQDVEDTRRCACGVQDAIKPFVVVSAETHEQMLGYGKDRLTHADEPAPVLSGNRLSVCPTNQDWERPDESPKHDSEPSLFVKSPLRG